MIDSNIIFFVPHRTKPVQRETEPTEDDSDYEVDDTTTTTPESTSISRTKKRGKITSQSVNSNTSPSITTKKKSTAKETVSPTTAEVKRKMSEKFNGVSFRTNDAKFMAYVKAADKKRYLGGYQLAADAAFAVDKCKDKIKKSDSRRNFACLEEYFGARNQEVKDSGLELDAVGTFESLKSRVEGYIAKSIKELSS